ncbi:MAG: acyltransferase [Stellaceae bacterium]
MPTRDARPVPIPALTGLRFIAAISVALAHGLAHMTTLPGADPFWRIWLINFAAFGMSAFFVLSGFVIHYNYSDGIVDHRWRGAANFFSARFARLYPLYITCIMLSLYDHGYFFSLFSGNPPEIKKQFWELFPYYLTMTQSWKFSIVESNSLVYGYPFSNVAAISWSISTEFFFYISYPFICIAILRLHTPRRIVAVAALIAVGALVLMRCAYDYSPAIDRFGVSHFGPIAGLSYGVQDSFWRWLIYFAPYSRLPEFMLGCLIAALYRQIEAREPSALENRVAFILAWLSVLAIVGLTLVIAQPSNPAPFLSFLHMNFGFAIPVSLLIFCLARYRSAISAAFSGNLMVRCGDASYSIYLLHIIIIPAAGLDVLNVGQSRALTSVVLIRLGVALLITVSFSLVTYQLIEVPARRWLRRILTVETRAPGPIPAPSFPGRS